MILLLAACASPDAAPASGEVAIDATELVFTAVAGECDERSFTVSNARSATVAVTVAEPLDTCVDRGFRAVAASISLAPGASATLDVAWCPSTAGSCASVLPITWSDDTGNGDALVTLLGAATSPDADDDGYRLSDGDCDDARASVNPGATEAENGLDDDCDGDLDEDTPSGDDDGDGFSERQGDCDDTRPLVFPGSPETINALDDDCDGWTDNHTDDFDDDGDGYTEGDGDCNDLNRTVLPLANEFPDGTPNGIDDDCDGEIDETTP